MRFRASFSFIVSVLLLVPVLAILLMAVVGACGWMVLRVLREVEKRGSHVCPACSGLVSNTAVKCPHCQTEQPLPYHAAGFCGLPAGATVDPQDATAVRTHHRSLLSAHRCPICATPLKDKLVCDRCATRIWEQGFSREELVRILDLRMALGVMCGVFASALPVVGFVLTVAFLNMGVLRIVRFYESRGARAVSRFLFSLFKWSALLVAVIFSSVPFVGALFLVPYICSYLRSRSRFLR